MAYGLQAQIKRHEEQITQGRAGIKRLKTNGEKWEAETDEAMTARLRRNRTRLGMREARYRLNEDRRKPDKISEQDLTYRTFALIEKRWNESRAGFSGVELRLEDLARGLDCSTRQLIRVINALDQECGLVVRIPGKPNRYAISLPETAVYQEALLDTFAAHAPQLQVAAAKEAAYNRTCAMTERDLEALRPLHAVA